MSSVDPSSATNAHGRVPLPPDSSSRRVSIAAFFAPPLAVAVLLYHVLADLQVTVLRPEALGLIGGALGGAVVLGLVAAFGGQVVRALVLAATAMLWIDAAFGLAGALDRFSSETRVLRARDQQRLNDIRTIQQALETHIQDFGTLPRPGEYGEGMGPWNFWEDWWDVSSEDGNGDGRPFLGFLVDRGILAEVPVDPINQADREGHPTRGQQYVYLVAPDGYQYRGGQCGAHAGYSTYLLAVTDLEGESERPPTQVTGSGCECLWRDAPNFFQQHFDYLICGRFRP